MARGHTVAEVKGKERGLAEEIDALPNEQLSVVQAEAIAFAEWLKRWAQALLKPATAQRR